MLLEYFTSNIILRIEMLTMKKFFIFCILAWFPFLQGLLIRPSRRLVFDTLFSFLILSRSGLYPTEEEIVQHELKKNKHTIETRTFLWLSHFQVSEPSSASWEVRGFEDLCHSFLILLKWHELFV